ncbi:hypothetical protein [Nocardia salmonicida]|uniref:hypothetical protein n=1 Tax=Nocardia salmonicida TaxID=53431 RepID=UPI0007A3DF5D|nr:hypothetical protein [Nocardia salmonicida]
MQRALGAAGTIAVGAAVNIGTSLLTDHREAAWLVTGIVVLLLGAVVQWWLPVSPGTPPGTGTPRMDASNNIVGGSLRQESNREAEQTADDNTVDNDFRQQQKGAGRMSASRNDVKGDFDQKRT